MKARAVVVRDGRVLMVKEYVRSGAMVWNFPGGSVEEGETPEEGCVREVYEETGYRVEVVSLLDLSANKHTFVAKVTGGTLNVDPTLKGNEDLVEAAWVSLNDTERWDDKTRPTIDKYRRLYL